LKVLMVFVLAMVSVVSQAKKETITFIHTDHLGSPIMATNEDGSVKWREDYQPFGKQLTNQDTDNNVGFTGHKDDKSLGLTYMQARWYHPEAGRFMSLDPIRYRDVHSFNRYVYANNNPYKYVDPDGKSPKNQAGLIPFSHKQINNSLAHEAWLRNAEFQRAKDNRDLANIGKVVVGSTAVAICVIAEPCGVIAGIGAVGGGVAAIEGSTALAGANEGKGIHLVEVTAERIALGVGAEENAANTFGKNAKSTFDISTGLVGFLNGSTSLIWSTSTRSERVMGGVDTATGLQSTYNGIEGGLNNEE
ncbi:RHS repeat domain-containing protein, partial [Pleionea mediterranea]